MSRDQQKRNVPFLFPEPPAEAANGWQMIANYLGTGQDPHLYMNLSDNGAKWNPFTVDYQQSGQLPLPDPYDPKNDWSVWNVVDKNGNYYGSLTVRRDSQTEAYTCSYQGSKTGYELSGVHFQYNEADETYGVSVDKIVRPAPGKGPFPDAPRATQLCYKESETPISLSVQGAKIVASNGQEVSINGVVRPSLEWNKQGQFLSQTDLENMANAGASAVRLDLNQAFWFASESVDTPGSYQQIIDAMIYYAGQLGMAVILDLHWTDESGQPNMANKDAIKFWGEVATRYKGFGNVIFELFNEPFNIEPEVWLKGNDEYAGMQDLYQAVRDTGAMNPVIINGLDYGYDLSFLSDDFHVQGENIIYGFHPYDEKGRPGYQGQGGDFEHNLAWVRDKYPLIATEFGDNNAADYSDSDQWKAAYEYYLGYFNENGIHRTGFAWWIQDDNPAFPVLIQGDWADPQPAYGGTYVLPDLKANPGTNFGEMPAPQVACGSTSSLLGEQRAREYQRPVVQSSSRHAQELYEAQQARYRAPAAELSRPQSFWARVFGCCVPGASARGDEYVELPQRDPDGQCVGFSDADERLGLS